MTVLGEQPKGNIWILKGVLLGWGWVHIRSKWLSVLLILRSIAPARIKQPCGKVPLKTTILHDLIWTIFPVMEHNAISSLFLLEASAMSFHYRTILKTNTWATATEQFRARTVLWQWPIAQAAKAKPLLFFQNFHFLEAKKNLSIQGGPKKASYQFWQGRQFLLA